MHSDEADLDLLKGAAHEAGALALTFFRRNPNAWSKAGGSPVTEADMAVDAFLRVRLLAERPDYGWLSEETADDPARLDARDDLRRRPDRRHARLHRRRRPLVREPRGGAQRAAGRGGALCAGARRVLHRRRRRRARGSRRGTLLAVSGRRCLPARASPGRAAGCKTDAAERTGADIEPHVPSLAYRLALVADGALRCAFASPRAHDWDLAACDLLVHEAGGRLTGLDGAAPRYNREIPRHGVLAAANARAAAAASCGGGEGRAGNRAATRVSELSERQA